jgi:hypothetical protein
MRPAPIKITLGDKDFTIRPLTLGQIQEIDLLLKDKNISEVMKTIQIIRVALSRDNPTDAENILEMEIPMNELGPTVFQLLKIGGMVAKDVEGNVMEALQTGTSFTGA